METNRAKWRAEQISNPIMFMQSSDHNANGYTADAYKQRAIAPGMLFVSQAKWPSWLDQAVPVQQPAANGVEPK